MPNPFTNPYQQRTPGYSVAGTPAPNGPTGKSMGGLTPGANGTFSVPNPFSGTQSGILDAIKNQPLPFDASSYYNQMMDLYKNQMTQSQGYYNQMLGMQNQMNDLLSYDPGAAIHEQIMRMYEPVQQRNTMSLFAGY
jgi:hypothetical protein